MHITAKAAWLFVFNLHKTEVEVVLRGKIIIYMLYCACS